MRRSKLVLRIRRAGRRFSGRAGVVQSMTRRCDDDNDVRHRYRCAPAGPGRWHCCQPKRTHARTHATDTRDGRALRQIDGPVAPYTGRALSLSLCDLTGRLCSDRQRRRRRLAALTVVRRCLADRTTSLFHRRSLAVGHRPTVCCLHYCITAVRLPAPLRPPPAPPRRRPSDRLTGQAHGRPARVTNAKATPGLSTYCSLARSATRACRPTPCVRGGIIAVESGWSSSGDAPRNDV